MGQVIGFLPASGGVGASTLAVAVAVRAAAADRTAVVVDLDPWSGGLDVRLGLEQEPGWRWGALSEVDGLVDGDRLLAHLPATEGVAVLASDRGSDADEADSSAWELPRLRAVPDVIRGLRVACEVVVVDLARVPQLLSAMAGCVDVLVVAGGTELTQLAALAPAIRLARTVVAEPWLVLRGAGHEALTDLLMDRLDAPVVGMLRDDRRTFGDLLRGVPPGSRGRGPFVEVADTVLLRAAGLAADVAADVAKGRLPATAIAGMASSRPLGWRPEAPGHPLRPDLEWSA